jgi:hypothetical protein
MYLDGVKRVPLCEEFNLFPTQLYAYLRRNGVQNNRIKTRPHLCLVCGAERKMPPYSPNAIWRNIQTCGDPACKSVLYVRPDLYIPLQVKPGKVFRRVPPLPWEFMVDTDTLDGASRLTETELAALERAFSLRADERGLDVTETAKKALWGRLSKLTIAICLVSEGPTMTSIKLSKRGPLKEFFSRFFGKEAEGGDVSCFDVLYLWRCDCPEQTSYVVRSIAELPVLPGDYGVCSRCGAAALEIA